MLTFAARRWRNLLLILSLAGLILLAALVVDASLREPAYLTGWLLLAVVLVLTLFNVRKKLPFLPLGRAATWLQFHIWLGVLSIIIFGLHIGYGLPNGPLEVALAVAFVIVAFSGIAGIFISRVISLRLTRRGEEVIYERIPQHRRELREEADELVRHSVEETSSTTIADFYGHRIRHLFTGPRDYFQHLLELNHSRYALQTEFMTVGRYLNAKEEAILGDLLSLVLRNDELNYHRALQLTLKTWLFVHIPLTYSMLILAVVHLILVHAFGDGLT